MIHIYGPTDVLPENIIDTTSHSTTWSKGLSPFFLGPITLYDGYISYNMENAWQYSKVYDCHLDSFGNIKPEYWSWARKGWASKHAERYPMGKGKKPEFLLWKGKRLDYITARKKVYVKLYSKAVYKTNAYKKLLDIYRKTDEVHLFDFDGYNCVIKNDTYDDILNDNDRKMGHAFVLANLLLKDT